MTDLWDFKYPTVCKIRLYFNALTTITSAILLVAVAVVRYRKICAPFGWQISVNQAKIIVASVFVFSIFFCIPYAILNGLQSRPTPRPDIIGYECTVDDEFVGTIWPLANNVAFVLIFFACCVPLCVLYTLIGVQTWRHRNFYGVANFSKNGGKSGAAAQSHEQSSGSSGLADTKSTDAEGQVVMQIMTSEKSRSCSKRKTQSEAEPKSTETKDESKQRNNSSRGSKKTKNKTPDEQDQQENPEDKIKTSQPDETEQNEAEKNSEPEEPLSEFARAIDASGAKRKKSSVNSKGRKKSSASILGTSDNVSDKKRKKSAVSIKSLKKTPESATASDTATLDGNKSVVQLAPAPQRRGMGRTTRMLICISVIYVIGFVPFLTLNGYKAINSAESVTSLSFGVRALYELFYRFYFLNSAANPIVYGICDPKFRLELRKALPCRC